jgi:hypothetical protein
LTHPPKVLMIQRWVNVVNISNCTFNFILTTVEVELIQRF